MTREELRELENLRQEVQEYLRGYSFLGGHELIRAADALLNVAKAPNLNDPLGADYNYQISRELSAATIKKFLRSGVEDFTLVINSFNAQKELKRITLMEKLNND
jgi:hypothetical protein